MRRRNQGYAALALGAAAVLWAAGAAGQFGRGGGSFPATRPPARWGGGGSSFTGQQSPPASRGTPFGSGNTASSGGGGISGDRRAAPGPGPGGMDGSRMVRVELKIRPVDAHARQTAYLAFGTGSAYELNDSVLHYQVFATDEARELPVSNVGWVGEPGERGRLVDEFPILMEYDRKPMGVLHIPWEQYREIEEGYKKLVQTFRIEVATNPWEPQDVGNTELVRKWLEDVLDGQARRKAGQGGKQAGQRPVVDNDTLLRQCVPADHPHWWARSFYACLYLVHDYWENGPGGGGPAPTPSAVPATAVTNTVSTNGVPKSPEAGGTRSPLEGAKPSGMQPSAASPKKGGGGGRGPEDRPAAQPESRAAFHMRRVPANAADLLVYTKSMKATAAPTRNFSYGWTRLALRNNTRRHIALCMIHFEFGVGASGSTVVFRDIPPGGEADGEEPVMMVGDGIEESEEAGAFLFPALVLAVGADGKTVEDLYETGETPSIGFLPLKEEP